VIAHRVVDGVEVVDAWGEVAAEVAAVRRGVAISAPNHLSVLRFQGDAGWDALERRLPGRLNLREGQLRPSLLLDEAGRPTADLLVGQLDGDAVVVGRGAPADEIVDAVGVDAARVHEEVELVGVDGPFAWELLAAWDTPGVIGLPYLGAYRAKDGAWVLRAGGAGEFGYLVLGAPGTRDRLLDLGQRVDARAVGFAAMQRCGVEAFVYDPWLWRGPDALELQLTWRLDLTKDAPGLDALRAHRAAGLRRRVTALRVDAAEPFGLDTRADPVTADGQVIGHALVCARGGPTSAIALLDAAFAHPGQSYEVGGRPATSVSAPFVLNRSLFVNPQKHEYARRHEIELPEELVCDPSTSW
jgi:glycine cleavage system aminomethyltransferase T